MANDTTSTLDSCKSVQGLMVARCKQFNDLLDDIVDMVEHNTKMIDGYGDIDDTMYAASTLADLIGHGIEMAANCKYFEAGCGLTGTTEE